MIAGPERYLLIREAAERARVAESTFAEWARRGRVPCRKAPGARRVLVPEAELERWLCDPGIELEVARLARGGRVVRPKPSRGTGKRGSQSP
jgi:excisionase family DNA binding protein